MNKIRFILFLPGLMLTAVVAAQGRIQTDVISGNHSVFAPRDWIQTDLAPGNRAAFAARNQRHADTNTTVFTTGNEITILFWPPTHPVQATVRSDQFSTVYFPVKSPYPILTSIREPGWPIEQRCLICHDIPQLINRYAGEIAEYCDFDLGQIVFVPLDSEQLTDLLDDSGSWFLFQYGHKQILLLGAEYHINRPVRISKKDPSICGIRQWLKAKEPEIFAQLTLAFPELRQTNSHRSGESGERGGGSGSGAETLLPESYSGDSDSVRQASLPDPDDDRVKLFFRNDGSHYPSIIVFYYARFRHLRMYRVGQPNGEGLMTIGCDHRAYYCPDDRHVSGFIDLYNSHLEDLTGHSDFLVRVDSNAFLIAGHSTFNFLHKNSDSHVFDIKASYGVSMDSVSIHNAGAYGTAISWDGLADHSPTYIYTVPPSVLNKVNITASAGASITGIRIQRGEPPVTSSQRPRLTRFTFGQGVTTGFDFPDYSVPIQAEGNTGNRMENPEGVHCMGAPSSGMIYFTDGTTCFATTVPVSATTPAFTSPDSATTTVFTPPHNGSTAPETPVTTPGAMAETNIVSEARSVYEWRIWIGLVSLYPVVLSPL